MESLLHDLRYSLRKLARAPGFALAAILSLGLGIGANTAIYSLVDAVLLDPLPTVEEPERLVAVYTSGSSGYQYSNPSFPDYLDYAKAEVFDGLAAYSPLELSLSGEGENVRLDGALVTGNYFDVLGLRPQLGRLILADDDDAADPVPAAVLSDAIWKGKFGGDRDVIGRTIQLNGHPFTIIGVAPPGFRGVRLDATPDVFIPMRALPFVAWGFWAEFDVLDLRQMRWLSTVGRLKDGATLAEARAALDVVARRLEEAYPESNEGRRVWVEPATLAASIYERGDLVRFVVLLSVVVALSLLIACANVANLLLARSNERRREIAVRLAVGARQVRVSRQLLTESAVLGLAGGLAGVGCAALFFRFLVAFELPGDIHLATLGLGLHGSVLMFALGLSLVTGLAFGTLPALRASPPNLVPALKDQVDGTGGGRSRSSAALVTAQVALCVVLLIGAGLFVRSLKSVLSSDLGFRMEGVLAASLNLGPEGYDRAAAREFYSQLLARAQQAPGVTSAALAMVVPVDPGGMRTGVTVEGYEPAPDENMELNLNLVSAEYFRTLRITLLAGRRFDERDSDAEGPSAVIINATMASRYWPGEDVLGKRISFQGPEGPWAEVVGIAADSRYRSLKGETPPYIYAPLERTLDSAGLRTLNLVVRAEGEPAALTPSLRRMVAELDPGVPLFDVRTVETQVREQLLPQRMGVTLLSLLGLLALVLAAVGIYGVVAAAVVQRTREIGVRAALGAAPGALMRLMVGGSLRPALLGLGLGLGLAWLVTDAAERFLFGISPTDPVTFAAVSLLLVGVAVLAALAPAVRAARIDPMEALRHE